MNWGYKILVVVIVFVITMSAMVFIAFKQENEMVETNYYEKEMNYQSLIDAADNLNKVSNDTLLVQDNSNIILRIPAALVVGFEKGQIEFMKADNEKKDLTVLIKPNAAGVFTIEKSPDLKGTYKARIRWTSASKTYYREQEILIK